MKKDWKFWAAVGVGALLGANYVGQWIPDQFVLYAIGVLSTLGISGYYVPKKEGGDSTPPSKPTEPTNPFGLRSHE